MNRTQTLAAILSVVTFALAVSGCKEDAPACSPSGEHGCCGTTYPGIPMIDPDNPVFTDSTWSQQAVEEAFAQAKLDDGNDKYEGYVAANKVGDLLECAFCACGCSPGHAHKSAMDCFKDMHAFS